METEGFRRCRKELEVKGARLSPTDRNRSITKYLREKMPDTAHFFDVWHIAKSKSCGKLEKCFGYG